MLNGAAAPWGDQEVRAANVTSVSTPRHLQYAADHHAHGLHRVGRGEPVDIGELIGDLAERPVHRDVPQCLFGPEPLMDPIVADA